MRFSWAGSGGEGRGGTGGCAEAEFGAGFCSQHVMLFQTERLLAIAPCKSPGIIFRFEDHVWRCWRLS